MARKTEPLEVKDNSQNRQNRLEQWRLRQEAREAKRCRREWVSIAINAVYAGITLILAIVAYLELTDRDRPWIALASITTDPIKPSLGKPVVVHVQIVNSGKSPAVHAVVYGVFKPWIGEFNDMSIPLTDDDDIRLCARPKPIWNKWRREGSQTLPGASNLSVDRESPPLDQKILDVLADKSANDFKIVMNKDGTGLFERRQMGLFLVGCIDYFDQFHRSHRTSFCYRYRYLPDSSRPDFPNFTECEFGLGNTDE